MCNSGGSSWLVVAYWNRNHGHSMRATHDLPSRTRKHVNSRLMKILLVTGRLLGMSLALAIPAAFAQSSGPLLVANQKDHTLSLIDPVTATQTVAIQEDRITGH